MIEFTEQQVEIIKALPKHNYIKVNAFAGAGKTSTLKGITDTYKDLTFLYLAFNKSVQQEAESKLGNNVTVKTTHSLALSCVKSMLYVDFTNFGQNINPKIVMDRYRVKNYAVALLITKIFSKFCNSVHKVINAQSIKEVIESDFELNLLNKSTAMSSSDLSFYVNLIWSDMENNKLSMSHDFYLKYFHIHIDGFTNLLNYDVVLLDEAQDTNEITLDIFENLPGKKIFVGDTHQQIYSFRGSVNAMEKFTCDKTLYLTETFRFPNSISKDANFLLNSFLGEKQKIISHFPDKTGDIETKCYITRTNAGLIELFSSLTNQGKIVKTVRDVDSIFGLILSLYYFDNTPNVKYNRQVLLKMPVKWILQFNSIYELKGYADETNDIELKSSIRIIEEYGDSIIDIYNKAKANRRKKKVDYFITTAHTAKGQEWDDVVLHGDFPDIIQLVAECECKTIKEFRKSINKGKFSQYYRSKIEEFNLLYVAITRGILSTKVSMPNSLYLNKKDTELDIILTEFIKELKKKKKNKR